MKVWFAHFTLGMLTASSAFAQSTTKETSAVADGFLRALQGDSIAAYEEFAEPNFIQHAPEIADGMAGLKAFVAKARAGGMKSSSEQVIVYDAIVVDGDLFAVFSHVFLQPNDRGRAIVDLFRVENGRIAEHWNSIQTVPENSLHNRTMWCGKGSDFASAKALGDTLSNPTCGTPDPKASRDESIKVIDDYVKDLIAGRVGPELARWFTPDYIQHSPTIADGRDAAVAYMINKHGSGKPRTARATPPRIIAQGDFVIHHHRTFPPGEEAGLVQFDIFRIHDGKMSEHWDIKQPVVLKTVSGRDMW